MSTVDEIVTKIAHTKLDGETHSDGVNPVKILVCGGSFGGKSFLNTFISKLDELESVLGSSKKYPYQFDITLVDPRDGFINILAIPRSILNLEFARTTYSTDWELPFDSTESSLYRMSFVQGKIVAFTDLHTAKVQLVENEELSTTVKELKFDYCVYATGRARPWPFDPKGYTKDYYLKEMQKSLDEISKAAKIAVIGGGAVGIETAAELVHEFPEKAVKLIHPYPSLPPEDLDKDFKDQAAQILKKLGVELHLNTRLDVEKPGGFVTTAGEFIEADLILWCGSKKNNLQPLIDNESLKACVDFKSYEVTVNDKMQMVEYGSGIEFGPGEPKFDHFFAVGDVAKVPVIKAAGGAYAMANVVANNLFNKHLKLYKEAIPTHEIHTEEAAETEKEAEEIIDDSKSSHDHPNILDVEEEKSLTLWSNGMLMLIGPDYALKNRDGEVVLNDDISKKVYADFCNGFVSTYYKLKFENVEKWT